MSHMLRGVLLPVPCPESAIDPYAQRFEHIMADFMAGVR